MAVLYFIEAFLALVSVVLLNIVARKGWKSRSKTWQRFMFFFIMAETMMVIWLLFQGLQKMQFYPHINVEFFALLVRGIFSILGIFYFFYKKTQFKNLNIKL